MINNLEYPGKNNSTYCHTRTQLGISDHQILIPEDKLVPLDGHFFLIKTALFFSIRIVALCFILKF